MLQCEKVGTNSNENMSKTRDCRQIFVIKCLDVCAANQNPQSNFGTIYQCAYVKNNQIYIKKLY